MRVYTLAPKRVVELVGGDAVLYVGSAPKRVHELVGGDARGEGPHKVTEVECLLSRDQVALEQQYTPH